LGGALWGPQLSGEKGGPLGVETNINFKGHGTVPKSTGKRRKTTMFDNRTFLGSGDTGYWDSQKKKIKTISDLTGQHSLPVPILKSMRRYNLGNGEPYAKWPYNSHHLLRRLSGSIAPSLASGTKKNCLDPEVGEKPLLRQPGDTPLLSRK